MLRFLFLRFLPRRLIPLIALFEVYRLFRRFQAGVQARPPRRLVVSDQPEDADVTSLTPPKVDGQVYGG